MARSVSYPRGAVVAFTTFEAGDVVEDSYSPEWDWFVDDVRQGAEEMFPSLRCQNFWINREDRVIASNRHAYVGISEYDGLVAVWMTESEDAVPGISRRWIDSVAKRFVAKFGTLHKLGTLSNGESVFEGAAA